MKLEAQRRQYDPEAMAAHLSVLVAAAERARRDWTLERVEAERQYRTMLESLPIPPNDGTSAGLLAALTARAEQLRERFRQAIAQTSQRMM